MQVVNELIRQLRSKGLLSSALLQELQQMGFDGDGHQGRYMDGCQDRDDWPGEDAYEDWRDQFWWPDEVTLAEQALAHEALAAEAVESTLIERRPSSRGSAVQGSRDERLVAAINAHEWPRPLLDLLDDVGTHATATRAETGTPAVLDADEDALDLAVRTIALDYPGALTKMWTALIVDPSPASLQPGAGPEAGLLELLLQADGDVAIALRYKAVLAHDVVREAVSIVRAHRRLFGSLGRLLVELPDEELGWHLQFNTDPLLYEVALLLYNARQPRLSVGALLDDDHPCLPALPLLPDDPFRHGWPFAAMADPIRVLPFMRWCLEHWNGDDLEQQAYPGSVQVRGRLGPGVLAPRAGPRLREHVRDGLEAWWDRHAAPHPRVLALTWTETGWSRLTVVVRSSKDDVNRLELALDGTVWEASAAPGDPPLTSLDDLASNRHLVGSLESYAFVRIERGVPRHPPVERWDVGTQLARGLHNFPVLRCAPEWSQPRSRKATEGAVRDD